MSTTRMIALLRDHEQIMIPILHAIELLSDRSDPGLTVLQFTTNVGHSLLNSPPNNWAPLPSGWHRIAAGAETSGGEHDGRVNQSGHRCKMSKGRADPLQAVFVSRGNGAGRLEISVDTWDEWVRTGYPPTVNRPGPNQALALASSRRSCFVTAYKRYREG